MSKDVNRLLRDTEANYSEYYVREAAQEAESILREIEVLARRLDDQMREKVDGLRSAAGQYADTDRQVEKLLQTQSSTPHFDHTFPFLAAQSQDLKEHSLFHSNKSSSSGSIKFPNRFELLQDFQHQGIMNRLHALMQEKGERDWELVDDDQIVTIIMDMQAQIEANSPPSKLPDGTPIDPYNKENETTLTYFQEHIQHEQMVNPGLEYLIWLEETYGKTEWREKVESVDSVLRTFGQTLARETVMGTMGTVQLVFQFATDPVSTTQEVLNSAIYLVQNPQVIWEGAKKLYKDFENGTPEQKTEMLTVFSSFFVPGMQVNKLGKAAKLGAIARAANKLEYPKKIVRLPPDMGPIYFKKTPEGKWTRVPNVGRTDIGEGRLVSPNGEVLTGKPSKVIEPGTKGTPKAPNIDLNRIGTGAVGDFQNVKDVNDLISRIPADAKQIPWREVTGGAKEGIKFRWVDEAGKTWDVRAHSIDPSAPPGSNAANGWIYRVEIKQVNPKWKWTMDSNGNFHKENVLKENSPYYNESIANETHIPFAP
ncbi:polymorphic toxin type 30 domain-containing protein [Paenibacillus aceti]|uniref:Bacterial toxin 30 domain-containing protein n=1 Tax=Paenibacillus aceti TaxID=1820010 RepID=A0ABQ1VWZ7_9BACL|nr:polymorphic toxin type 30 domain-containing protein [Paenibacillus aceti]GGG03595.1 hypothetical protein GCM10010913_26770 [Paenibacillus aceti]